MKFSLRQLMIFVTISALVIGVIGYSFNRIQIEHRRAELALMEAIRNQQMAEEQANVAKASAEAKLAELKQSPQPEFNYSILPVELIIEN